MSEGISLGIEITAIIAIVVLQVMVFKSTSIKIQQLGRFFPLNIGKLQQQFKEALETHFPTRSDYREVWRKEIDELNADARHASAELNKQLAASTAYIQAFVNSNQEFFSTFAQLQMVMKHLIDYTKVQGECYTDLKGEINGLRQDFKQVQISTLQMNKDLLEAIRTLTIVSKEKNNHGSEEK